MAGWQEDEIHRAVRNGDIAGAMAAYQRYLEAMNAAGQRAKPPGDFGIG